MPVMDVYTATASLREDGIETPIFALTANAMKGFEQKCLDAGCTGFLTKPIDIDALIQALADPLGGERKPGPAPGRTGDTVRASAASEPARNGAAGAAPAHPP